MEKMDQNQAVDILIQAANSAQLKGAFTLKDAVLISTAIDTLTTKPSIEENVIEDVVE